MKHISLLVILVIYSMTSFGQYFAIDTSKGDSPYNQMVSFIFPHLKSTDGPAAADSINRFLIRSVLAIEPGTQKRSIFENVWGSKPMDIATVGDISFKIVNNDADFFCIGITATVCTVSCKTLTRYYTFDTRSGKDIPISELFSKKGLQAIYDSVHVLKVKRIQDYIDTLKFAIQNKTLSDEDIRDYNTAIGLYGKCAMQEDMPEIYSLDKAKLSFNINACLPAKLFFVDKIDRTFSFDIRDFKDYLTKYGRALVKL